MDQTLIYYPILVFTSNIINRNIAKRWKLIRAKLKCSTGKFIIFKFKNKYFLGNT